MVVSNQLEVVWYQVFRLPDQLVGEDVCQHIVLTGKLIVDF